MGLKYIVSGFNYPAGKTPSYEKQSRWFVVVIFWLAVFSIKYDGVNLCKRR